MTLRSLGTLGGELMTRLRRVCDQEMMKLPALTRFKREQNR
jgi:hypothetical protein